MLELAAEDSVALPASDPEALAAYMNVDDARSLEEYLERFRITLELMQRPDGLERIAYELAEDNAREGVRYLETRFCPALNTEGGLSTHGVMEAVLDGLHRAEAGMDIRCTVIVCGLRSLDPSVSLELARLAVDFRDDGVVAFDLAGAEHGNPSRDHREAFAVARAGGLHATVHAGEGYGPDSIRQALDDCGAERIGHGTRLFDDPELEARIRDAHIPLEICLTSNVQTRVVASYDRHPLRRYFDEGIPVSLCTDNRLMSGTTLTREFALARDHLAFTPDELVRIARTGFECAFLPPEERTELLEVFDRSVAELV